MSAKTIKDFQNNIKKHKDKNPEAAVKLMIEYGDYLCYNSMFKEALAEFVEAKQFAAEKLPAECIKKEELEYKIDRGLLCGLEKDSPLDQLNEFVQKYENAKLNLKLQQDFTFTVANSLIYFKKVDEAAEYLTKSMDLLNQFPKKHKDLQVRRAQLYGLYVDVAFRWKGKVGAMKFIERAFECKKLKQDDPLFYFDLLKCKRNLVPREEKKQLTTAMYEVWVKNLNTKKQKLDTFFNLFEDFCWEKDFLKAEEMCWKIYSDKECLKFDKKEAVKKSLILMHKLPKRFNDIERFKTSAAHLKNVVYIYQKIADEFYLIKNYELAYEYFEKMKAAAINLPENGTKLQHISYSLESLFSCLNKIACCQNDFQKALQHLEELLPIQESLGVSVDIRMRTQLDYAVIKSKCENVPFEEKKLTLMKMAKDKLKTDYEIFLYYSSVIDFIKSHGDEGDYEYLDELENEHEIYKEKTKGYKDPPKRYAFIPYTDENDAKTDEEILKITEEKWINFDEIQLFKKKLDKINGYGESELWKAISSNSDLEHIKFLIEDCGYDAIIEKSDNRGVTPIYLAVMENQMDVVKYLFENGANINAATTAKRIVDLPAGTTPLMEAIRQHNPDMIQFLLQKGANSMLKNVDGRTALDMVKEEIRIGIKSGSSDVLEELKKVMELLKTAENDYKQNHDEPSQRNMITPRATSPNGSNRSRHLNNNGENIYV